MENNVKLTGRLTLSSLNYWYRVFNEWNPKVEEHNPGYMDRTIRRVFSVFKQSDFILDTFFSQHPPFQGLLTTFAEPDCSIEDIEALARITLEITALAPDIDPEVGLATGDIEYELQFRLSKVGPVKSYNELSYFLSDVAYVVFPENPGLAEMSVLCLSTIYGMPVVMEILKQWNENTGSVSDLISVTQNWEELKTYPFSWAVEIARSMNDLSEVRRNACS